MSVQVGHNAATLTHKGLDNVIKPKDSYGKQASKNVSSNGLIDKAGSYNFESWNDSIDKSLSRRVLTYDTINVAVRNAKYAVRGEIPHRASELKAILHANPHCQPFKKIIQCNIGNPQELGQHPLTFLRQVAALTEYTALLDDKNREWTSKLFPKDAIERAKTYKAAGMQSLGAYSHSQGLEIIRKHIAEFIEKRDGFPAQHGNIFLTNGASSGVKIIADLITAHPKCGMLIPIPQYPLYTATMTMVNGTTVPYYLDEENGWALSTAELEKAYVTAQNNGVDVRSLVVINPGNPTGSCLSKDNIREIIEWCYKKRVVILADEVYQANIYNEKFPFVSFRHVLKSMGTKYKELELVSFHSISKGFVGECGKRGGYFEICGFDPKVKEVILKSCSTQLCANLPGQIVLDCMIKPPVPGDISYPQYAKEKKAILDSLARRAKMLVTAFNDCEGITCNTSDGAMYAFPSIHLPAKFIAKANETTMTPDAYYCLKLLEATGV
eukprot:Ihof_evm2s312 gene=Ihof_evmTU2s312